ncbi:hypothetical protein Tco_1219218 [Tanacetum coccineum]
MLMAVPKTSQRFQGMDDAKRSGSLKDTVWWSDQLGRKDSDEEPICSNAFTVNNELVFHSITQPVLPMTVMVTSSCTDHIINEDPINDHIPIPSIEQVTIATPKTQPQVSKPKQIVVPSCAQHVKTPRQPLKTPETPLPIPSNNRQNWNPRRERELATPALTNTNRVNKANQFTPKPVNVRPNLSTASKTIKTVLEVTPQDFSSQCLSRGSSSISKGKPTGLRDPRESPLDLKLSRIVTMVFQP